MPCDSTPNFETGGVNRILYQDVIMLLIGWRSSVLDPEQNSAEHQLQPQQRPRRHCRAACCLHVFLNLSRFSQTFLLNTRSTVSETGEAMMYTKHIHMVEQWCTVVHSGAQ